MEKEIQGLVLRYLPGFFFVLLRASVFMAILPVLGSRVFPARFRMGLAVGVALVLTPVVDVDARRGFLPAAILREIALAAALGLSARFVFFGVEMAGQLASDAMGMSIATVLNPEIGPSTEIARLQGILAMLLLLATDAHHELVAAFAKSYEVLPPGTFRADLLLSQVLAIVREMFVVAVKLCAPVVVGVITANLLLGFVYKAVPQINIFFAGFPLLLFLGLLLVLLTLSANLSVVGGILPEIRNAMGKVLAAGTR